MYNIDPRS